MQSEHPLAHVEYCTECFEDVHALPAWKFEIRLRPALLKLYFLRYTLYQPGDEFLNFGGGAQRNTTKTEPAASSVVRHHQSRITLRNNHRSAVGSNQQPEASRCYLLINNRTYHGFLLGNAGWRPRSGCAPFRQRHSEDPPLEE